MGSMEHHIYTIFLAAPWIMALKRSLFKTPEKGGALAKSFTSHLRVFFHVEMVRAKFLMPDSWINDQIWSNMIKYDQIWSNDTIKQISNRYQTAIKQLNSWKPMPPDRISILRFSAT